MVADCSRRVTEQILVGGWELSGVTEYSCTVYCLPSVRYLPSNTYTLLSVSSDGHISQV